MNSIPTAADALESSQLDFLKSTVSNVPESPGEIDSPGAFDDASEVLKTIKASRRTIDNRRKELVRPYNEEKQVIQDAFNPVLSNLDTLEANYKRAIAAYIEAEKKREREEQAAAEEKARKAREAIERKAHKAREKGQHEKADALEEEADQVVADVPVAAPKASGISTTDVYSFRLVDIAQVNPEFLALDEKKVRKMVDALKEGAEAVVGGIKVTKTTGVRARS